MKNDTLWERLAPLKTVYYHVIPYLVKIYS